MLTAKYNKQISISINPEIFHQVKEITDKKGISMSEWFRKAVEQSLIKQSNQEGEQSC